MNTFPQRRSIRLQEYDYSQKGLYFVTICCQDKICRFGDIAEYEMILNNVGQVAKQCWLDIPKHFPHIVLHEFIIMPNHIHGILEIAESVEAKNLSPEGSISFRSPSKTIGSVIRGFKIGVSKWFRENQRTNNYSSLHKTKSIWQRNYYEHIIRDSYSHKNIADYIINNPYNWQQDDYYYI
jgi:REP element-mobilizing transposase RayT